MRHTASNISEIQTITELADEHSMMLRSNLTQFGVRSL